MSAPSKLPRIDLNKLRTHLNERSRFSGSDGRTRWSTTNPDTARQSASLPAMLYSHRNSGDAHMTTNMSEVLKDRMMAKEQRQPTEKGKEDETPRKRVSFRVVNPSRASAPKRYYHHRYRDGSLVYHLEDVTSPSCFDSKRVSIKDIEDDLIDAKPTKDSLQDLRRDSLPNHEPLSHYRHSQIWKCLAFAIFLFLFICSIAATATFVFKYNHGVPLDLHKARKDVTFPQEVRERSVLNMHLLLTAASVLLRHLGALIFRMFPWVARSKIKWIHGFVQLCASAATVAGLAYSFSYYLLVNCYPFHSMHAYLAVATVLSHTLAVLTGLGFVLPCCSWECRLTFMPFHQYLGRVIILMDGSCVITGFVGESYKSFDAIKYPKYYLQKYEDFSTKGILLNAATSCICLEVLAVSFILSQHGFRRRRPPDAPMDTDLDSLAINMVVELRRKRAVALEAKEQIQESGYEEVPLGSRKSYNSAVARQNYWRSMSEKSERTILALINETENRKNNFDDAELLLALE